MAHIIIGTAGHIDHGKTALVRALTGVDTDRLKEERERGLTIDLGFAHLGDQATIIDVPGHEKFVRNMVAGVSTIDLVLFVIAADDGVMPQTREHFDILKLLQVQSGIIVITKADLVDADWRALVEEDVRQLVAGSFLAGAPLHFVSSETGEGIRELKAEILSQCEQIERKMHGGVFWMPVDRVFIMKGFGTVVTGSVLSGSLASGQSIEILPQGMTARVRAIQSHGQGVEGVARGDRAAVNLQAVDRDQLQRGNIVTLPGQAKASLRFDARLQLLASAPKAVTPRTRVRLHVGTTEVMARISIVKQTCVEPGQTAYVQFHLEEPTAARRMDPFVIRRYSPTTTIGGGVILNADAPRRKLSASETVHAFRDLEQEDPLEALQATLRSSGFKLVRFEALASHLSMAAGEMAENVATLARQDQILEWQKGGHKALVHREVMDKLQGACLQTLAQFHELNPLKRGGQKAEVRQQIRPKVDSELFELALQGLVRNKLIVEVEGRLALTGHRIALSDEMEKIRQQVDALLYQEGFTTSSEAELASKISAPLEQIQAVLTVMIESGGIVRVEQGIYFHRKRVEEARVKLIEFLEKNQDISISQFKDLVGGASRKFAMPLINYFDSLGVTRRQGDVRVLNE